MSTVLSIFTGIALLVSSYLTIKNWLNSKVYLGLLFSILALQAVAGSLTFEQVLPKEILVYGIGTSILSPLLLSFFTISELTKNKTSLKQILLHFLPIAIAYIPLIAKHDSLYMNMYFANAFILWALFWNVYYIRRILLVIKKHQIELLNIFSSTEGKDYRWLRQLVFAYGLMFFAVFILGFLLSIGYLNISQSNQAISIFLILFIAYFSYFGFRQISVKTTAPTTDNSNISNKPIASNKLACLAQLMETNKPFIDSELTLYELAKSLKINSSELSALINKEIGCNFYEFVNRYRVEEFKKKIKEGKHENLTILSLAYDSGFASKATFYRIFKKIEGCTPSEFAKQTVLQNKKQ